MHPIARRTLPVLGLLLLGSDAQAQFTVYGVTGGTGLQRLVRFNSATPSAVMVVGSTGANLTGIDFRPATGVLYGYNGSMLYTIDLTTGAATQALDTHDIAGENAGFDFNPTVDRIRITDASGTNLRVNPNDGVALVDGNIAYTSGTAAATVTATAYTNSFAGATTTALFGIDSRLRTLVSFVSPNAGTITTVGSLGIAFDPTINGFDIVTTSGINTAFLVAVGAAGTPAMSSFYSVNLGTGAATFVGTVGATERLQGIAVQSTVPEPGTLGLFAGGLALGAALLRRRRTLG
jgi:hypothetical protein